MGEHTPSSSFLPPEALAVDARLVVRLTARRDRSTLEPALSWAVDDQCDCDCDCACPVEGDGSRFVLSGPYTVYVELTAACNNRCPGCSNVFAAERSSAPLDAAIWEEVLTKLQPGVRRLKITGGEPTLHPQFEAIVGHLAAMEMPFVLFTNARWQDAARLTGLLRSTPQCRGLLVSLHGATAASHEAYTGVRGSYEETLANIGRATRAELGVTTSTVITGHNWAEIADIVRLSRRLGAHHAVFNRYLGAPHPALEPTPWQLRTAIEAIERHVLCSAEGDHSVKFGNCIPQCFATSSATGCLAGVAYCTVDPWGNVRPCNHALMVVGNLVEQGVDEVWHSEGLARWREMIPAQCRSCQALPRCHGGCRAVAVMLGKDPLMRSPLLDQAPAPLTELYLYEGAHPVPRFVSWAEPFGLALARENRLVPVAAEAQPVLDACDGTLTLQQVEERFGQGGLDLVGLLCREGLMGLD